MAMRAYHGRGGRQWDPRPHARDAAAHVEPSRMKHLARLAAASLVLTPLAVRADHIPGYQERPLTVREARAAIAVVQGAGIRGWLKASVGGESVGIPPEPRALREVCFEIANRDYLDKGCASSNAFIDDLFTTGEVSGTFDSVVTTPWGAKVADSRVTLSATWNRPSSTCNFPHDARLGVAHPLISRQQAGAPVTPYADSEFLIACLAEQVSLSMSSAFFSESLGVAEIPGTPAGIMGLYAAEFWHLPETCIPDPNDLCVPE